MPESFARPFRAIYGCGSLSFAASDHTAEPSISPVKGWGFLGKPNPGRSELNPTWANGGWHAVGNIGGRCFAAAADHGHPELLLRVADHRGQARQEPEGRALPGWSLATSRKPFHTTGGVKGYFVTFVDGGDAMDGGVG
jgi:hypothetical protein